MWSKTWRRYLVPAARLAVAQLAFLSAPSLLPAQDGNSAVRRQPLPPIISTKDPAIVPPPFQTPGPRRPNCHHQSPFRPTIRRRCRENDRCRLICRPRCAWRMHGRSTSQWRDSAWRPPLPSWTAPVICGCRPSMSASTISTTTDPIRTLRETSSMSVGVRFMAGAGPSMVFAVTDAYFRAVMAAKQVPSPRARSGRAGCGQR